MIARYERSVRDPVELANPPLFPSNSECSGELRSEVKGHE